LKNKIVKINKNCGGGKSQNHEKNENESNNYQFVMCNHVMLALILASPLSPPQKIEIFERKKT